VVWDRLYQLKQRGTTLVLTTHYMDEAEQLCDRLVVMDGGRIVAEGAPHDLIATHSTPEVVELRFPSPAPLSRTLDGLAARIEELPDRTLVYTSDSAAVMERVAPLNPTTVLPRRSTLEDVFLRLTGRQLVD
jgi:lipooligosaccharide transport system ATP-binding protein